MTDLEAEKRITQLEAQIHTHHLILFGDASTSGLVTRVRDLEKDYSEDIKSLKESVDEMKDALLGDLSKGPEAEGLVSKVDIHEQKFTDLWKLGWVLIGALITLIISQVFQAIVSYQALNIIR